MSRSQILTFTIALVAFCIVPLVAQENDVPKKTVTFEKAKPSTGDFFGASNKTSSAQTTEMTRNGESREPRTSKRTTSINREVTILLSEKDTVKKAQVFYKEAKSSRPSGGRRRGRGRPGGGGEGQPERAKLSDLEGQTFILDFSGATPKVTNAKGEAVAENVAKLVLRRESKDGKFAGWGSDMIAVLGKNQIAVGEVITLDRKRATLLVGNQARSRFGMRSGRRRGGRGGETKPANTEESKPETIKATLTLKGIKTVFGVECGEFALSITDDTSIEQETMSVDSQSKLTGTVLIGVKNGWLYSLKVEGSNSSSMSMARGEMEMEVDTVGTTSVSKTVVYSKKKLEQ